MPRCPMICLEWVQACSVNRSMWVMSCVNRVENIINLQFATSFIATNTSHVIGFPLG